MGTVVKTLSAEEYEAAMRKAADGSVVLPKRELNRREVVQAFHMCFENIGGVPRMALWADENPTEFFKLYARLLPSQSSQHLGGNDEFVVKHVLPKGALDE